MNNIIVTIIILTTSRKVSFNPWTLTAHSIRGLDSNWKKLMRQFYDPHCPQISSWLPSISLARNFCKDVCGTGFKHCLKQWMQWQPRLKILPDSRGKACTPSFRISIRAITIFVLRISWPLFRRSITKQNTRFFHLAAALPLCRSSYERRTTEKSNCINYAERWRKVESTRNVSYSTAMFRFENFKHDFARESRKEWIQ